MTPDSSGSRPIHVLLNALLSVLVLAALAGLLWWNQVTAVETLGRETEARPASRRMRLTVVAARDLQPGHVIAGHDLLLRLRYPSQQSDFFDSRTLLVGRELACPARRLDPIYDRQLAKPTQTETGSVTFSVGIDRLHLPKLDNNARILLVPLKNHSGAERWPELTVIGCTDPARLEEVTVSIACRATSRADAIRLLGAAAGGKLIPLLVEQGQPCVAPPPRKPARRKKAPPPRQRTTPVV